jgi:transcription termination factor Rho
MSEPQLERSVLEAKEREELYAIADALGTKPGSRAKKSDLIAQILRATGVETDDAAPVEKPRRTRARKVAVPAAGELAEGTGGDDDSDGAEPTRGGSSATAAVAPESAARPAPSRRRETSGAGTDDERAGDAERLALEDTPLAHREGVEPGSSSAEPPWAPETLVVPASNGSDPNRPWTGEAEAATPDADSGPLSMPNANGANGAESGSARFADSGRAPEARPVPPSPESRSGRPQPGYESHPQAHSGQQPSHPQQGGLPPGGQQHGPAAGQSPGPGSGSQQGPNGVIGDRPRFDGDPGNRRNRRRRGRDRTGAERAEHDLQGPVAEQPQQFSGEPIAVSGLLDLRDEGYGFLRTKGFLASPNDVYVSISQVRRFALRKGDRIEGACRPAATNEKYPALLRIDTVTGLTPDEARQRPKFEDLTPLFPDEKLRLEVPGDPANMTARIVDLISPIGKGQRGLIVSPPKAGKTTVLKQIAHSIEANNPEVHLMVLLVDERPEEVTDMRRSVKGEVIASTFDRPSDEHTQVAELTIERAKRLVEVGKDVVIVLDGITRLARAYNLAQPATGRIMSGGIDTGALYPPKKFFGSARNIEEGGSLTILATALVETGSRMDEVIFEEFKGTGNMELRLDRKLAERRIYPALDVNASSTRHEELLFDRTQLQQVWKLRRVLNALGSEGTDAAGLQLLMDKIKTTRSNDEFLAEIAKTPAPI